MNVKSLLLNYSYQIIVTLLLGGVYFFVRFKIRATERKKLKSIKRRDIPDAVETDTPVDNYSEDLREKGITGIEDRFSFINKALPLFIFSFWFLLISIPYLGSVPSVYISVLAAVFSVVAGVSLRPFLENLFSGVVISFFRSIKVGDTVVIDDHYGQIEEIGLTYSVLKRWDWFRIVIPNSKLLEKEVQNLTMNDNYLWAHVEFYVSPESDLILVEKLAKNIASESPYFNHTEAPSFWVKDLQKDSILCWVAAWADTPSDAWELRCDIRTRLTQQFQKHGIPFHQYNFRHGDNAPAMT